MSIMSRYIVRKFIIPFVFGMGVIIFLFLINYLIKQIPTLLSKDVPVGVIIQLVSVNLAWIIALAIPMSVLIATLTTFGTMSADNEITALKASGYGMHQALVPILVLSIILGFLNFRFNDVILPELNHKARQLLMDINLKKPSLTFQEGIFSDEELIKGYRLKFDKIDHTSNWVYGVTIIDLSEKAVIRTIVAEKATLDYNENENQLVMNIFNGEMHDVEKKTLSEYRRIDFDRHRIRIDVESTKLERTSRNMRSDREKNIAMLRRDIVMNEPKIEIYQKALLSQIRSAMGTLQEITPESQLKLFSLKLGDIVQDSHKRYYIKKYPDDPLIAKINSNPALVNIVRTGVMTIESERRYLNKRLVEIQKKYSLPAACVIFIFIGIPLGIRARHGGVAVGGGLSILFFLIYWAFLITGEQLADRNMMSPWLAMWLANIIVGLVGVRLTVSMIRETPVIDRDKWTTRFSRLTGMLRVNARS